MYEPVDKLPIELPILPIGAILVHNLTQVFAGLLSLLNPAVEKIQPRTAQDAADKNERRAPGTEK